jgi:hypothetical protein
MIETDDVAEALADAFATMTESALVVDDAETWADPSATR